MLGIGFLALLGVGVAMSMSGGSDDVGADEVRQNDTDSDEISFTRGDTTVGFIGADELDSEETEEVNDFLEGLLEDPDREAEDIIDEAIEFFDDFNPGDEDEDAQEQEYDPAARNALILGYVPIGEVDEATDQRINDFLDTLDPDQPIDEAAGEFRAFVTDLGVEIIEQSDQQDAPEPETEVDRPPMGDDIRDPLIVAEELEAQRILDEIAAEEARQPVNLVTVTGGEGEVDDAVVMTEGPSTGEDADRSFIVTGPDVSHDINVGYDDEHTFKIEYNEQTDSVTAGLNANIEGPEGAPQVTTSTTEDADGNLITETRLSLGFDSSTDITINITPEQIGTHVAQIELINPADSLDLNFSDDVLGNFHLVFFESEEVSSSDTSTMVRAFVVQTASDQASLSDSEVSAIAEAGEMRTATTNVLAEIYLGSDALTVGGATPDQVTDFINDRPIINTNIGFASVSAHGEANDDGSGTTGTGTGQGADGDDDDISGVFRSAGLNPQFFGF